MDAGFEGDREAVTGSAKALLDAVVAIGSDLDIHHVLDRIVISACELTGARFGALGVVSSGGGLADFIAHGIDPHTRAQIGELPHGRGLLGLLIDKPEPVRIAHLQEHPASYGFPAHHPPMDSFLGVPVRVRGAVFGNLYLTEKAGGVEFTEQDEALVLALANAAGYVIENARAFAVSERQRKWLESVSRLNESLQPMVDVKSSLQHVAVGAREVSGARAVAVISPGLVDQPEIAASDGRDADQLPEYLEGLGEQVELAAKGEQPDPVPVGAGRTALVTPIRAHLFGLSVLVLVLDAVPSAAGSPVREHDLIRSYADQAALALDRVQALADRQELAVVSDRDRIARDLHDLVIQRLFATGLHLQGTRARAISPEVKQRIDQEIADLDATVRDIRGTIFELQQGERESLRAKVRGLLREYVPVLGFSPTLRIIGPLDTAVPENIGDHLLAVLREALSNVARHASATNSTVEIAADGSELRLVVTDDGVGLPGDRAESGLRNVRRRAQELEGAVWLRPADPSGTRLEWRVPLGSGSG